MGGWGGSLLNANKHKNKGVAGEVGDEKLGTYRGGRRASSAGGGGGDAGWERWEERREDCRWRRARDASSCSAAHRPQKLHAA